MTTKAIVLAVAIATGAVAIPLVLKSKRAASTQSAQAQRPMAEKPQAARALPKFVDLGTTTCAPCKVMLGVMAELERKYPGAFIVEFVNVQENPEGAQRYGIQIIPTQIFYGPDGHELYRHVGVFRTEEDIAKWAELGFHFQPTAVR